MWETCKVLGARNHHERKAFVAEFQKSDKNSFSRECYTCPNQFSFVDIGPLGQKIVFS